MASIPWFDNCGTCPNWAAISLHLDALSVNLYGLGVILGLTNYHRISFSRWWETLEQLVRNALATAQTIRELTLSNVFIVICVTLAIQQSFHLRTSAQRRRLRGV
jgi:hypothetical protein